MPCWTHVDIRVRTVCWYIDMVCMNVGAALPHTLNTHCLDCLDGLPNSSI